MGVRTCRRWAVVLVGGFGAMLMLAAPAWGLNAVAAENRLPGTTAWQLPGATPTTIPDPSTAIEGYASQISLAPGSTLSLHVSSPTGSRYRVEIYRLGWYGGKGGRLMTCVPACTGSEPGIALPTPPPDPQTGELDAGWPVTDRVPVGLAWVSGYYLAKLVLVSGPGQGQASEVPFVVRAPAGVRTPILVQASVNTWEAYNIWGTKSLYAYQSTGPVVPASQTTAAAMVSFDRPFASNWNTTPLTWEYGLVRYLERHGYAVSYQTDVDTDQNPASLLHRRLDVVNGHDEYWSPAMRNAWEAARAAGVNEVFLGGNIGYWQARYADHGRTLVEYRSATLDPQPNPAFKTVPFSALHPPRPECTLLGVGYPGGLAQPGDPPRAFAVTAAAMSNPWFAGTGLTAGSTIADSVGYEWDTFVPGCAPSSSSVLLHWSGTPANADAVTYTAGSGARVFSSGSMQLTWALDDYGHPPHADGRLQALFQNMFGDLGGPALPSPAAFRLTRPARGSMLWNPQVTLRWQRSSAGGIGLAGYEVVVDGQVVAFTRRASYTLPNDLAEGRHTWRVLAIDRADDERGSSTLSLRIASARLPAAGQATVLSHGLTILDFCPPGCRARVTVDLGGRVLMQTAPRHFRTGGIKRLTLPLTASARRRLAAAHGTRLTVTVITTGANSSRTVSLVRRW